MSSPLHQQHLSDTRTSTHPITITSTVNPNNIGNTKDTGVQVRGGNVAVGECSKGSPSAFQHLEVKPALAAGAEALCGLRHVAAALPAR